MSTLRDYRFTVAVVEKWNHVVGIRQDMMGILDIIAINARATIGVQSTSKAQMAAHRDKLRQADTTAFWMSGPRFLVLAGWSQAAPRCRWKPTWERAVMNADGDVDFRPMVLEDLERMTCWESPHGAADIYPF